MKRKLFTEEQIAFALRQAESGTTVGEICRKMKAICASENFDLFMVLPYPTATSGHAAKLEFSSKDWSKNRGQVTGHAHPDI